MKSVRQRYSKGFQGMGQPTRLTRLYRSLRARNSAITQLMRRGYNQFHAFIQTGDSTHPYGVNSFKCPDCPFFATGLEFRPAKPLHRPQGKRFIFSVAEALRERPRLEDPNNP